MKDDDGAWSRVGEHECRTEAARRNLGVIGIHGSQCAPISPLSHCRDHASIVPTAAWSRPSHCAEARECATGAHDRGVERRRREADTRLVAREMIADLVPLRDHGGDCGIIARDVPGDQEKRGMRTVIAEHAQQIPESSGSRARRRWSARLPGTSSGPSTRIPETAPPVGARATAGPSRGRRRRRPRALQPE